MERLPWIYDEAEALTANLEALRRLRAAGITGLIDVTPLDLGRQISLFQKVAAADTGVHIVCATGAYRWIPAYLRNCDPDTVADHFLRELRDGIEGSGIRPGIIKLAWDLEHRQDDGAGPSTPRAILERVARGAARAARTAGVPISCHTLAADQLGIPLLDLLEDEGMDLRAVTIGHSNDTYALAYLLRLAERGATIGLDRYFWASPPEEKERRARLALDLARAGFAEQVSLGHDACPYSRFGGVRPSDPNCWLAVSQVELPWLRANGAGEDDIDAMMRRSIVATFEAAARMSRK
jgi:phosphotriesterase-related protein